MPGKISNLLYITRVWMVTAGFIAIVLFLHPRESAPLAWTATVFTSGKYLTGVFVILMVLTLFVAAGNRFRVMEYFFLQMFFT